MFIITWWLSLFCVLPIGVRSQWEEGDVAEGTEEAAPAKPMLKKKALWATYGAVGCTLLAYFIVVPWLAAM